MMSVFKGKFAEAARGEAGSVSVMNLYFILALAILGGIGVDTANLLAARNQLQVAADVAAHAAMYSRGAMDADDARAEALRFARANMPAGRYGDVLQAENIHFGTYDFEAKVFTVDEASASAVWVETNRLIDNANPVSSYLLRLIGFSEFDVRTTAIFVSPEPCFGQGFFANGRVDMQSNNEFWNEFCIHSNSRVEFNQNNFFEHLDGVRVSAPSRDDLITPAGSWGNNVGLEQAWQASGKPYYVDVDAFIDEIILGIQMPGSEHFRPFITSSAVIDWPSQTGGGSTGTGKGKGNGGGGSPAFTPESLTPGRIHNVSCSGGDLSVGAGTYSDVVVITDCAFNMANGVILENATFISTSTDPQGVLKAPQGLQIGRDDNCAFDGGAQLILKGSMRVAAKLKLYGGQIIAAGDVKFAAQGNGFAGASVIAGGEIDGTSNSIMGLCADDGTEDFFDKHVVVTPRLAG